MFTNPTFFSNLNSNCSNLLDVRNLMEQVKKGFCYQRFFREAEVSKILQKLMTRIAKKRKLCRLHKVSRRKDWKNWENVAWSIVIKVDSITITVKLEKNTTKTFHWGKKDHLKEYKENVRKNVQLHSPLVFEIQSKKTMINLVFLGFWPKTQK